MSVTTKAVDPVDERLPIGKLFMLGLQHVLVMYAGAVAVPLIIGGALGLPKDQIAFLISADLMCCGIATLLQSVGVGRFGIRMPVIMAVTFAAVGPMLAIGTNPSLGLPGIFGATIASGIIGTLIAPVIGKLLRFFPPIVTGIVITSIGLTIIGVGINWAAGGVGNPDYGDPVYLGVSFAVLIFILLITRFVKGFFSNIAVLLGILFGFVIALMLHKVNFDGLDQVKWFDVVLPFHFGMPVFDPWAIVTLTIVILITFIESTGMFLALGEIVGKPVDEKALVAGLRVDGVATVIGGLFNTFPHTSFSQNIGLVGVTGVKSRWVCAAAGVILLVFGLIPKMSVIVASIPQFVLGGAGVVMFGMVLATGIKILSKVDYAVNRYNLYIVAISIGMAMIPVASNKFFAKMPEQLAPLLHSGILLATLSAVILNAYFNGFKAPAANGHGKKNGTGMGLEAH
ncbi:nucleobase:cation symporter-2 family protein [Pandoraea apista]|uniref:Purine permease n=1 Tax=Pandoraea apista TaxID=93218 RepID=A0A0B5F935_9BURK|nr:nucleobase:cation symporter-2 family protein [Pandoraea apista]AJE99805.1 purine permease [Pandoraea apista]AKH73938.1 purine permease [Pandoraea apista]AKI62485.1 purine permease [Pandoraea apista]ALS64208.1 purine permease [Pandoraea apista]AVF40741.1 purine permease [Pandoraea apista]